MSRIISPSPGRTPIGYMMVDGKRLEVQLDPEWARYFDTLAQRSSTDSAQIRNIQSAVDMSSVLGSDGGGDGGEMMPTIPGKDGATGATGPALGFLMTDPEAPDFLPGIQGPPGATGAQGARGDAGPALFVFQDSDASGETFMIAPPATSEAFIAPALTSGWVNYFGSFGVAGYYKDPSGVVHLRGLVSSGTTGPIFTLPAGYRPYATALFSVVANNAFGRIDILASGDVTLASGTNTFVSLEGITFRAT